MMKKAASMATLPQKAKEVALSLSLSLSLWAFTASRHPSRLVTDSKGRTCHDVQIASHTQKKYTPAHLGNGGTRLAYQCIDVGPLRERPSPSP